MATAWVMGGSLGSFDSNSRGCIPTPALKDCKFQASLSYLVRDCLKNKITSSVLKKKSKQTCTGAGGMGQWVKAPALQA